MKVVLLAGGLGTRLSEETESKPKPMIEIGGMPIIWHIMKEYYSYGFDDFIICAGYKQHVLKKWFDDYRLYTDDMLIDYSSQDSSHTFIQNRTEPWKVRIINTGLYTNTGGRIKKIQKYIDDDTFMVTYGDGVCDVNINELLSFHNSHGKVATLTTVYRMEDKGRITVESDNRVRTFREKNREDDWLINAGYMVFNRTVFNYLTEESILETETLTALAEIGELMSFEHKGFWHCMDTLTEKKQLEKMVEKKTAPWVTWE